MTRLTTFGCLIFLALQCAHCDVLRARVITSGQRLTVSAVRQYHIRKAHDAVDPLLEGCGTDPKAIMEVLEDRYKQKKTISFMSVGLRLAEQAAMLADEGEAAMYNEFAINLADHLCRKYINPVGTIVEYDRNTWLDESRLWRTIPWGVNFRCNEMLDVYARIKDDLSPEQLAWWQATLQNVGTWIYKNPIVGTYVFNCAIDLTRVLWRIGAEFDNEVWTDWALWAAKERIERDVDAEGWIHGESGGVSGTYQLVGMRMIALFAFESGEPLLKETLTRFFPTLVAFSSSTLQWAGNFGTRSSHLWQVYPEIVMVAGALGDPVAGYFIQQFAEPSWADDLVLWEAALAAPVEKPVYSEIRRFKGINSVIIRSGPLCAALCNYERSRWARGFTSLWHDDHNDWLFASLLAIESDNASVKKKLQLGETSDWAAFPHVRVQRGDQRFDSQQRMMNLDVRKQDVITAAWDEPLLDIKGSHGGMMHSNYRFDNGAIDMQIRLRRLAGPCRLDFHMLKHVDRYLGFWDDKAITAIERGDLPVAGGQFRERSFQSTQAKRIGLQLDKTVFVFEFKDVPERSVIRVLEPETSGLHTGNHGGTRIRIEPPADVRQCSVDLRFRTIEQP